MSPGRSAVPSPSGRLVSADRERRFPLILAALRRTYPKATCALLHHDPFQLLVATILSAQSTDETVNRVTPILFGRFPDPASLAEGTPEEIERIIYPTGFFRQKARNIRETARILTERFGGTVPSAMEALISLPGVARKTANVVLGTAFGQNEGIVVDTHVGRLATRLGLTVTAKDNKDAVRIEQDLMQLVPRRAWTYLSHALIRHGRLVCLARAPRCNQCKLNKHCPSAGVDPAITRSRPRTLNRRKPGP